MKEPNPLQVILFFVLFAPGIYLLYIWAVGTGPGAYLWAGIIAAIIALLIAGSIKIADQWEKVCRYSDSDVLPASGARDLSSSCLSQKGWHTGSISV